MKRVSLGAAAIAGLLLAGSAWAADLKSGLQPGEKLPGPFHPLNITGAKAGQKHCLVWQNGGNPVAMIFAREIDGNLTSLVKEIDKATADNKSKKMGSFVVFLSDDKDLEGKIKELAEKEGLKNTVLTIDNIAGPTGYKVEKDAAITVVFYNKREVKVNQAFGKGQLKSEDVKKIMGDLPKLFE